MANGNAIISSLLENLSPEKPFSVVRCGIGAETVFAYSYDSKDPVEYDKKRPGVTETLHNNAGIYFHPKYRGADRHDYVQHYRMAIQSCDYMAVWYDTWVHSVEQAFMKSFDIGDRHFPATDLEPYYHTNPWSSLLKNKRVLIIHPFAKSIESQYKNHRSQLFEDPNVLPEFELLTLQSCNTSAGNRLGDSWVHNFRDMCAKIDQIEFDVALLGCGGYGLPLVNYIKNSKRRSAIYVGGALQILFGIKGLRWDNIPQINKFYNEFWVRPAEEEKIEGLELVEGGCYY
jgi:hypothetical protein